MYPDTKSELFALFGKVGLALNALNDVSLAQTALAVLEEKYPTDDLTHVAQVLVDLGPRPITSPVGNSKGNPRVEPTTQMQIPNAFSLSQNYPNPFNPLTTIHYTIPEDTRVSLVVYDVLGREVKTLAEGYHERGYYNVTLDASDLASGVYFYRLTTPASVSVKKLVVAK